METITEKQTEIHPVLRNRRSIRAFAEKPVKDEKLHLLFEAARWAPSSMNEQPWRFIYAKKESKEAFSRINETLMPGNKAWARDAAVLILVMAQSNYSRNGRANKHAWHDTGMAVSNLLTEATHQELYAHCMGGFDSNKAKESFNLPEDVEPVEVIALGYKGDPEKLDEPFRSRESAERKRKPVQEIAFEQDWNHSS